MFNDDRSLSQPGCGGRCRKHAGRRPRAAVTNTSKTVVTCSEVRFHYGRGTISQSHIYSADDSCCRAQVAVTPARALRRDTLHELRLAHDAEFFRAIRAVHGPAL